MGQFYGVIIFYKRKNLRPELDRVRKSPRSGKRSRLGEGEGDLFARSRR